MSFSDQDLAQGPPSTLDSFSRLNQLRLTSFDPKTSRQQFGSERFQLISHMGGIALRIPHRPVDAVQLVGFGLAADESIHRVCCDTLCTEMPGELPSPFAQGLFADVESHPLLAHRFHYHVHMRMRLVCMQNHCVAMLQC